MAFQGNKFIFDGIPGEQYGLMLANINNANQDAGKIGGTWKVHEDRIARRSVGLDYGVTANDPLSFPITTVAMEDNRHFDRNDIAAVAGWLTGHQSFKKLVILQDDMEDVYYKCRITQLEAVEVGMRVVGFTATVTCDGPYAYRSTAPQMIVGSPNGSPSTYFNPSNVNDYFYPSMLLAGVVGDVSIIDIDDGNRELRLVDLPPSTTTIRKSVDSGVAVRMDDVSPSQHTISARASRKNLVLYPHLETTKTVAGVAFTDNGDGTVTANGTATAGATYQCIGAGAPSPIKAGQYFFSGCPTGGSDVTFSIVLGWRKNIGDPRISYVDAGDGRAITFTEDGFFDVVIAVRVGFVADNLVFKPQLELGTTATVYTPYVFETTAAELIAQGKNLWSLNATVPTSGENTITIQDDVITLHASEVVYGVKTKGNPGLEVGKTYTFSAVSVTDHAQAWGWRVAFADGTYSNVSQSLTNTMTITKEVKEVLFYIGMSYVGNRDVQIKGLQIELGGAVTEYEPYIDPVTYHVADDGTCELTSIAPVMTLTANPPCIHINCEYNATVDGCRDIIIDCLHQIMTASDGINLYEYWNTDIPKYFPRLVRGINRLTLTGECQLEICGDVPWNIGN